MSCTCTLCEPDDILVLFQVFGISTEEVPRVGKLFDVTMAHVCHGHPLPASANKCLTSRDVSNMYSALSLNAEAQEQTGHLRFVSKLKMLPVLHETVSRMSAQTRDDERHNFVLYSGHDTSIAALLLAVDVSDSLWPPFASRVTIELLRSTSLQHYFVNIIYNGQSVTGRAHWCKSKLVDGKLCPLSVFTDYISSGLLKELGFSSYKEACSAPDTGSGLLI